MLQPKKGTSSTPWLCQGRTPEDREWWHDQEARRANRLGKQHGHCRNTQETENLLRPKRLEQSDQARTFPHEDDWRSCTEHAGSKGVFKTWCNSGYWQLKLDEESSNLCTFNTPFGRYRFLRVPFGIVSASEIFQRVMSQMVEDIAGSEAIMDDIVVWGKDQAEHDMRLKQVMDKAKACGLNFNKGKCKFWQNQISCVGHVLSGEGLKADPEKIRAVQDMKWPQSQRELMTFLRFIRYLKNFMPSMADISAPLRKLTEKDVEWKWTETEENSFNKLKKLATASTQVLRPYITSHTLSRLVIYRSWLCHHAGRPTNSIHLMCTDQSTTELCTNWKRDTGSGVWVRKVPSVCVWSNCRGRNGPQTPAVNLNKPLHQAPARL